MQLVGHLPLGEGKAVAQAVPQLDHLALPGGKGGGQKTVQLLGTDFALQIVADIVLRGQHIHKRQGVAVLVGFNRLVDGNVLGAFLAGAEEHQNFIFNASCRIGGKLDVLPRVVGVHRLNEADGANGDQVVLVACVGVVFFGRCKRKDEFSRSKTASQGPPNFK